MGDGIVAFRARPSDLGTVVSVLEEAARWLALRGIGQWEPGSFSPQDVARRIERGETFLFRLDGRVAGCMVLQGSDEEVCGETPDEAGYIHGLAVRRAEAGKGLGRELLRWAENRVAQAGRRCLRLDCASSNRALNEYYERAGFRLRGRVLAWGLEVSRYEKEVGAFGGG